MIATPSKDDSNDEESHSIRSALMHDKSTPRLDASILVFSIPTEDESTVVTANPCSASQTPFRPSPSPGTRIRPSNSNRWDSSLRNAFGSVPYLKCSVENCSSQKLSHVHEFNCISEITKSYSQLKSARNGHSPVLWIN